MIRDILRIALLCVVLGGASIPFSFNVNSSPVVVWVGNALGSLFSAAAVMYIGDRVTDQKFKEKIAKKRLGKKVVVAFDESSSNKTVTKAVGFINRRGLKVFALLCPIFPGVLLSTAAVYLLCLDKRVYRKWMFSGVVLVSGLYVFGYWWIFVK